MSRLYESDYNTVEQLIFPCECHDGHYVRIAWDDEDQDHRYLWMELHHDPRGWQRIKDAWRALRGRDCQITDIILSEETAASVHAFLSLKQPPPPAIVSHVCFRCGSPASVTNGQTHTCRSCGAQMTFTAYTVGQAS